MAIRINKMLQSSEIVNGFSRRQIASAITPKRLDLTILPTEKCNFRCVYCYEDFLLGAMPSHVLEGIENLIRIRAEAGLSEIALSWFGGEPLLAKKHIFRISSYAKAISDLHNIRLTGGLTTNGYLLTKEVLTELCSYNQNYFQISLDGWGDEHDKTRKRADGKGTFNVIWKNLLEAKNTDIAFTIQMRVHVTDDNYDSLCILCENIFANFNGDNRFYVDFQDVRNLGGDYKGGVSALKFQRVKANLQIILKTGIIAVENEAIENSAFIEENVTNFQPSKYESSGSRRDYVENEGYICYAAKPNHFLIRADGRVGKCTVAFNDARNDIGKLNFDGSIEIDSELAERWSFGLEDLDADKLGCPIAYWNKSSLAPEINISEASFREIPLRLMKTSEGIGETEYE